MDQISSQKDVEPLSADWTVSFYVRTWASIDFHSLRVLELSPCTNWAHNCVSSHSSSDFKYRSFWLQSGFFFHLSECYGPVRNKHTWFDPCLTGEERYKICMSNTHACLRRVQTQDVRFTPEVGFPVGRVCEEWAPEQFKQKYSNDYHYLPSNNKELKYNSLIR